MVWLYKDPKGENITVTETTITPSMNMTKENVLQLNSISLRMKAENVNEDSQVEMTSPSS